MIEEVIKKYPFCRKYKINHQPYGHIVPKNVKHLNPWDTVHVDMIGPWILVIHNLKYKFRVLTFIDAGTNMPEVIPVDDHKTKIVANALEDDWLGRYPSPRWCIRDNANDFLRPDFVQMLARKISWWALNQS